MTIERVSGVLTKWDLEEGEVPAEGEGFVVLRAEIDMSGPEPIRTIKRIRVGHKMDTETPETA